MKEGKKGGGGGGGGGEGGERREDVDLHAHVSEIKFDVQLLLHSPQLAPLFLLPYTPSL